MAKLGSKRDAVVDVASGNINALLGKGTEFEGKLTFEGIVRIDGVVRGTISSKDKLIIGETAKVEADITVGTAILCGELRGNIEASQRLEIKSTGKLIGDVYTPVMLMDEGAVLEGVCHMVHDASRSKTTGEHSVEKASVSLLKSQDGNQTD